MKSEIYNKHIPPFLEVVDRENGQGYSVNISHEGNFIKKNETKMLYQIKKIKKVVVVYIHYIHYETEEELLNLLAFSCVWWKKVNPHVIYYREKERENGVGSFLKNFGFDVQRVSNDLKPFRCRMEPGSDTCNCPVYEYVAYKTKRGNSSKTNASPTLFIEV